MSALEIIPIDELDVSSPALFEKNTWAPHFARLRLEKPVHYCANKITT